MLIKTTRPIYEKIGRKYRGVFTATKDKMDIEFNIWGDTDKECRIKVKKAIKSITEKL